MPWREAKTHVLTHGLHYASCVFEGERIYSGRIYKLEEHTARLFESARILGMKIPYTEEEINRACYAAAQAQGIEDGYVRPVVCRGSEMMAVVGAEHADPCRDRGVAMAVLFRSEGEDEGHPPGDFGLEAPRARHRADAGQGGGPLHDLHDLQARGGGRRAMPTRMMFDYRGYVAEATGANIFFVKDGKLVHADRRLLPRRHHAPLGDRAGQGAADSGDREAYQAGGAGRLSANASSPARRRK